MDERLAQCHFLENLESVGWTWDSVLNTLSSNFFPSTRTGDSLVSE